MAKPLTTSSAIATIKALPRLKGGKAIHWASDIGAVAHVAAVILTSADRKKALLEIISGTGAPSLVVYGFTHGHRAGGGRWPELRSALKNMGIAWLPDSQDRRSNAEPVAPVKTEHSEAVNSCRIDSESQDIIITSTVRLRYGTPEHRAKLLEVAHTLGVSKW